MKDQKVIISSTDKEVNDWIDRGWTVKSITAGHVTTTIAADSAFNSTSSKDTVTIHGHFCFLLEKN